VGGTCGRASDNHHRDRSCPPFPARSSRMYLVCDHKEHKPRARLTRAGLMPAKTCAALIIMRANLPGASDRSAKPGDCTV
jgi:hypothetical protein